MNEFLWILLATFVNGLIGLVGAVSFVFSRKTLNKIIILFVAFSAGALIAGAFFHLLPESLEKLSYGWSSGLLVFGFVIFFLIEKYLWHHCHIHDECKEEHKKKPFTYLVLFGDGIHNFIDGLIIAASFFVGVPFGIVTTLLIISHEIPQELGDFAVLLYGGLHKSRALWYNFLSQIVCVAGGIIGYFSYSIYNVSNYLLPFAAGGFIYIAASDLVPELHHEKNILKSIRIILFFLAGIGFILLTRTLVH
jgi:zinc and cadmium transporter